MEFKIGDIVTYYNHYKGSDNYNYHIGVILRMYAVGDDAEVFFKGLDDKHICNFPNLKIVSCKGNEDLYKLYGV